MIGPNLVTAIDIPGPGNTAFDDLAVGSLWNSGTAIWLTILRNPNGADWGVLFNTTIASRIERGNRVTIKSGRPEALAVIFRGASDTLSVYAPASSAAPMLFMQALPAGSDYVVGRFAPNHPLSQFLFYVPGAAELISRRVSEPSSNTFTLCSLTPFNLGQPICRVRVLASPNPHL